MSQTDVVMGNVTPLKAKISALTNLLAVKDQDYTDLLRDYERVLCEVIDLRVLTNKE